MTESCRSIPNFFGNRLIRYFVPHLDGLNYSAVNLWLRRRKLLVTECKQTDSIYFSSSAITPSHISGGGVLLYSSQKLEVKTEPGHRSRSLQSPSEIFLLLHPKSAVRMRPTHRQIARRTFYVFRPRFPVSPIDAPQSAVPCL